MKARELAAGGCKEGTVVIAEEQTRGRGRLGRSWSSPKHQGIWMSIVLKPDISPARAAAITQVGAASVWKALSEMGIETLIKWPNDILAGGRKVCGILAEMSAEMNKVNYIIAGIGINVNTHPEEFPEELRGTAASLFTESMHEVSRKDLAAAVLNNFESLYREFIQTGNIDSSIEICKSHSATLGRDIRALSGESEIRGRAVDITPDGELMVMDEEGSLRKLFYGEVSVRGMNGYV
jgi:BirA family biotin operon repressor/biotin-[acetyl-CoA-carboxylase] ligase